jgi:hypothetical protein
MVEHSFYLFILKIIIYFIMIIFHLKIENLFVILHILSNILNIMND